LADAKRDAEKAVRHAEWSVMLEVIQSIKPQLADVLSALATQPSLFAELAPTFTISSDRPLRKLEEISARICASLEDTVPKQNFTPAGPPLMCDTVIFAVGPFRFNDNGSAIKCIPGGFIGLLPKAVAKRAVEAGVGQLLTPPKKMIAIVGRQPIDFKTDQGLRTFAPRREVTIETDFALRLAREGKLEKLVGPSPTDMVTYQQLTVNRAKRAPEISLGTIRDETPLDDEPISEDPPSRPEQPQSDGAAKYRQRPERRQRVRALAGL
jgi:hypothetical protein